MRTRLTLIGPAREGQFKQDVLLSRSRFLAPATQTLRFYREYFKPKSEQELGKNRRRWLIEYRGTEFFVNLDHVEDPDLGTFLEVKSTTWSREDAKHKAQLTTELISLLAEEHPTSITQDYVELLS